MAARSGHTQRGASARNGLWRAHRAWRPRVCGDLQFARAPCESGHGSGVHRREMNFEPGESFMKRSRFVLLFGVLLLFALQLSGQEGKDGVKGLVVDKEKKTVTIDAKIAPRKVYKEKIYPLEVIACWPH